MGKNYLKKILLISVPIFFLTFLVPILTHAQFGALLNVFSPKWWIMQILYIISYIGTLFFSLASYLVGFFLKLNYGILESNNLIERGWSITRDIANLGFVLVIVIISLATILRFQEYGYKKLLPKLIAAAILVNFSLTLAGVFIDFSKVLTQQFFGAVGENESNIVSTLSGAFEPQKFYTEPAEPAPFDPEEEAGGALSFTVSILLDISKLLFTVIFIFAGAFTLFAFALMLLLRYIYLSFLLIISPIAWLFWVFPALSGQFRKWWNKFLEWIFFMPVVAFFFYLTLTSINSLNQNGALASDTFFKPSMAGLMTQGAKMVLLIGLLFGGLIVAQQMGITGAAGAMRMAQTAGNKTKKWAGDKMKAGGSYAWTRTKAAGAARHEEGKSYGERLGEGVGGKLAEWGSTKWGRRFGIGNLAKPFTGIAGASAQAKEKLKAEAEVKAKKFAPESAKLALNRLNQELGKAAPIRDSRNIVSNYEKVTQDEQLWKSLGPEKQNELNQMALEAGRQTNSYKVAAANTALAAQPGTLTDQEFAKALPEILKSIDKLPDAVQQAVFQRAASAALSLRDDHPDTLPLYTAIRSNEKIWSSFSAILKDKLDNKAEAAAPNSNQENRIKAALVNPELALRPNLLSADEILTFGTELKKSPQYGKMADTTRTDIGQLIAQAAIATRNDHPEIISTLTALRQSDDWDTVFSTAIQNGLINKMVTVGNIANRDAKLDLAASDPAKIASAIGLTTDKDYKDIAERIKEPAHITIEDPGTPAAPNLALTGPQLNAQIRIMQYLSLSQHGKIGSEGNPETKTNAVRTLARGIDELGGVGVFKSLKGFAGQLKQAEDDFERYKREGKKQEQKQAGGVITNLKTGLKNLETALKTSTDKNHQDAYQLWKIYEKDLKDTNYQDTTWP